MPPLDLFLLMGAVVGEKWAASLITMVAVDVLLDQPGCGQRWLTWMVWTGLLVWQRDALKKPGWLASAASLLGLGWYWLAGPALSWLAALAVALQGGAVLLGWRSPTRGRHGQSWGWRHS